jgi:hypothetical protein
MASSDLFFAVKQKCLSHVPHNSERGSSPDSSSDYYSMVFGDSYDRSGLIITQEKDGSVYVLLGKSGVVCTKATYGQKIDNLFADHSLFSAVKKAFETKIGSIYPDYTVTKNYISGVAIHFQGRMIRIQGEGLVQVKLGDHSTLIGSTTDLASEVDEFFAEALDEGVVT